MPIRDVFFIANQCEFSTFHLVISWLVDRLSGPAIGEGQLGPRNMLNKLTFLTFISAVLLVLGCTSLFSQELPRPSMARHETVATLPSDYNIKAGPVLLNVNGSVEGEYVDNIALTHTGTKSDFIITPQIGLEAKWPVTVTNTLRFSTSLGYSKYLIHPQYDTSHLLVAPDSLLSFDVYVGDFKINLHDQFSYQQDPSSVGSLSNVVNFSRFQNIAGVGVLWDLNKLLLTLNYDHINFISTELQGVNGNNFANASRLNYMADQVSASASYSVTSTAAVGLEAAASTRYYDHYDVVDNGLSVGPFVRIKVTPNIKLSASGGFQTVSTSSGNLTPAITGAPNSVSPVMGAGTTNGYYANLTLDHRLNQYYTDRFSAGHEIDVDVFSQQSDLTYVTYTSSWKVNSSLNLALTLNYQDVHANGGGIATGSYEDFMAGLQASFPVTKSVSGAVLYQFNDKFGAASAQSYLQNRVGFILNYHF